MKSFRMLFGASILLFSVAQVFAQEDKVVLNTDFEVQKYTVMERFEPGYIISAKKRAEMKNKRIADAKHTLSVLDTIKISNRKRKLILRDLKYNPFSDRLNQFIVDTKFEDEVVNQ